MNQPSPEALRQLAKFLAKTTVPRILAEIRAKQGTTAPETTGEFGEGKRSGIETPK